MLKAQPERWEVEVIHDRPFFDALDTKRKRFTATCNYTNYLNRLRNCHIALLPLKSTAFNSKKSDLKFVEQSIEANTTGMICRGGNELCSILNIWGEHPDQAEEVARNAHAWCTANRLQSAQSERRLYWYQSLWDRREELTQSLLQRVPELTF